MVNYQNIGNKETGILTNKMLLTYLYLKDLLEKANTTDILKENQILDISLEKNLKSLSVSSKFTSLASEIFEGIEGLENFQLNKNGNSNIHISNKLFKYCNVLTWIDLSYCGLKSVDLNTFADLEKLKKLDFSNNQIIEIIRLQEGTKTYLKELNLENNHLSNFFDDFENSASCFVECQLLENINLTSNKLNSIDFIQSSQLVNLKVLNLENNNLKIIKSQFFSLLYDLNYLNLSKNKISAIESDSFGSLFELSFLDLSENRITHLEPYLFYNLGSLKILNLRNNVLKEVKENYFVIQNSKLTRLDLSYNQISGYEKNSFTHLMGFNSSNPPNNAKIPESACIEMIILVGNLKVTPHHTDYDRNRSLYPRFSKF